MFDSQWVVCAVDFGTMSFTPMQYVPDYEFAMVVRNTSLHNIIFSFRCLSHHRGLHQNHAHWQSLAHKVCDPESPGLHPYPAPQQPWAGSL